MSFLCEKLFNKNILFSVSNSIYMQIAFRRQIDISAGSLQNHHHLRCQQQLKSAWGFVQSDQSVCCPVDDYMGYQRPLKYRRTTKS